MATSKRAARMLLAAFFMALAAVLAGCLSGIQNIVHRQQLAGESHTR